MVEKNTYSVNFFIKRGKLLKNGEAPIFLRFTVKGERVDITANQSVKSNHWDSSKGQIKSGTKEALDLGHKVTVIDPSKLFLLISNSELGYRIDSKFKLLLHYFETIMFCCEV